MKRSGVLLIVFGVVLAALSFFGVFSVLQTKNTPAEPTPTPIPTVKVVVAAQAIPERTMLQANMLSVRDWPAGLVPTGAASKPQDLVGKITSTPLAIGEPVLTNKVSTEQRSVGLAPTLPPGLVAVSVLLPGVSAVGGAVRQGDTVDLLVSLEYTLSDETGNESNSLPVTFYTLQDVPVLDASGGNQPDVSAGDGNARSVATLQSDPTAPVMLTLLVTPQDALLIKHAREQGTVDVVLRSPQFHDQVVTDPVYLDYVIRRFELPRPAIIKSSPELEPSSVITSTGALP